MLGFVIVDRQVGERVTAVWLTSRVAPYRAGHTNAVCVTDDDPRRDDKLRALVADRIVILTEGSDEPLPLAPSMHVKAIASLICETVEYQRRILEAVEAYAARSGNSKLVRPEFARPPGAPDVRQLTDAAQRALVTANYVAAAWNAWLATDEQRRRRTVDPRTGTTPWMMPDGMNSRNLAEFPPAFTNQMQPVPVS